ncbi:MAG: hemerythrin domain-containing protein [Bacteroidota bacterium]|nr:hemerythrin domain-containing protein [Bacteroidota bacterium]
MEVFNKNDVLSRILNQHVELIPVINRFGIKLGLQNKTISEVCNDHNVKPGFFLTIINAHLHQDYSPASSLRSFSPLLIVEYLRKTHAYYRDYILPRTKHMLEDLLQSCEGDCEELKLIKAFYRKYEEELIHHLDNEEHNVFPYIENLLNNDNIQGHCYSIENFEKEHSNVDIKINDLKQLIIKYITPSYNTNQCNEFLTLLSRFENDLKDHARIEDHVLVPMVKEIEKKRNHA